MTNDPKDFRGLIAVTDADEVVVIATTEDCSSYDLFINGTGPDYNCVDLAESLNVGFYHVRFVPWSERTYDGDYDVGINAYLIEKIGETPSEFLMTATNLSTSNTEDQP